MQGYWPTADTQPNASKHDKAHAHWYRHVPKVVLSKSLNGQALENTTVISHNLTENILTIKNQVGKNILIFGSPTASHALLAEALIDEFWIFVNPVLLGSGTPLFKNIHTITQLDLIEAKTFASGVVALHYVKRNK